MNIERRKELLEKLRAEKITKVEINVEGCGDSGEVSCLLFFKGKKQLPTETLPDGLKEFTEDTLYEVMTDFNIDFWNNDGGEGELILDVKHGTYTAHIDVNYMETSREVDETDEAFVCE